MGRLIELSHPIHAGMTTYPGLPAPEITDHPTGTRFTICRITLVGNSGTYLDTPLHRYPEGADLATLPLDRFADLDGLVVPVPRHFRSVDRPVLAPYDVAGRAVLIHTGWDRHWGTDAYRAGGHPYVTADSAAWLAAQGAALVGIDSLNIDDTTDPERPVHTTLLGAGIPVVEHLCGLAALPLDGFRFHAAPPMIAGMSAFPVRAYAVVR